MFGETEVNLFYLLIAAFFLFVCFPYTLKRTAVNDTNLSKTQNISILWWLEIWAVLLAGMYLECTFTASF